MAFDLNEAYSSASTGQPAEAPAPPEQGLMIPPDLVAQLAELKQAGDYQTLGKLVAELL